MVVLKETFSSFIYPGYDLLGVLVQVNTPLPVMSFQGNICLLKVKTTMYLLFFLSYDLKISAIKLHPEWELGWRANNLGFHEFGGRPWLSCSPLPSVLFFLFLLY